MKSLCTGSSIKEPAPPGRVLTPPPNPRLGQSEGGAQSRWHLSFRNPEGGTGGGEGGAALRDEHTSRDPESRGLSHA